MLKAVIFDLDGVIVSTDERHYQAWRRIADEEKIFFDREINKRLRGVSRMESLKILLENSTSSYSERELQALAERKNTYYRQGIETLTPEDVLPGVINLLSALRKANIKLAIGSSSKNCPIILNKIKLSNYWDAIADGNEISKSKPDPEVFLLAARKMKVATSDCAVIEDAEAGIEAALAAGMKAVMIGAGSTKAAITAKNMKEISPEKLRLLWGKEHEYD